MGRASPREYLGQKPRDDFVFVFRFSMEVGGIVAVVGLVPEIPGQNAWVAGEGAYDSLDVSLEFWILSRVGKNLRSGSLHPAGVVHACNRWMLRPELWVRI